MAITSLGLQNIRQSYKNSIKSFGIIDDQGTELFRILASDSRVSLVSDASDNPLQYRITVKGTDSEVASDIKVKGIKVYDATTGGNVLTEYTYSNANIIQSGTDATIVFDYRFNVNLA